MTSTTPSRDIMEQRVKDLGGSNFDATVTDRATISFEFAKLEATVAQALFKGGLFEFREPTLDENRDILCQAADGSEFHVPRGSATEGVDASGQKEAQCVGSAGETGTVVWKPALGTDAEGELRQLTGAYIDPGSAEVRTDERGICVPACVLLEFTSEGRLLFRQITTRLINYPLGVFLDDELIWAPRVFTVVSDGQTLITDRTEQEAEILSAQLNSGPLPVPVKLISIEEVP